MKLFLKIIAIAMLAIPILSCSSDNVDEPKTEDERKAMLILNVYAGDSAAEPSSRANDDASEEVEYAQPAYVYERMHTLRVIIVRPTGVVEHNEFLSGDIPEQGSSEYHGVRLEVIGGEKKAVYIFANEAGVPYDFNSIRIGQSFPAEAIAQLQLTASEGGVLFDNTGSEKTYIPMSELFEIDVKAPEPDGSDMEQFSDLFITRAAVKFGFFFSLEETISQDLYIESLSISKLGNTEFFLPKDAEYSPSKDVLGFYDRYISAYSVPNSVTNNDYTFAFPEDFKFTSASSVSDQKEFTPQLYFSETGLDTYSVTATLKFYKNKEKTEEEKVVIGPLQLDNLPKLPRNTYVKINAKIATKNLKVAVDVVPYTAVWLEPKFGFDKLLPHVPVYGEKPPWVEIWPPVDPEATE